MCMLRPTTMTVSPAFFHDEMRTSKKISAFRKCASSSSLLPTHVLELATSRSHTCRDSIPKLVTKLCNQSCVLTNEQHLVRRSAELSLGWNLVIFHTTALTTNGAVGLFARTSRPIFRSSFRLYVIRRPAATRLAPSTRPQPCVGCAGELSRELTSSGDLAPSCPWQSSQVLDLQRHCLVAG